MYYPSANRYITSVSNIKYIFIASSRSVSITTPLTSLNRYQLTDCIIIFYHYIKERIYCLIYKSLHSMKSFVLGELSFTRMPSRQYCLSVNRLHCYNWSPELVKCSHWQQYGVVTQHGMAQILGHPKLLQNLNAPHICQNWTFLEIQNFGQSMLGHHTILLSLAAMN